MPSSKKRVLLLTGGGQKTGYHNHDAAAQLITAALTPRFDVRQTGDVEDLTKLPGRPAFDAVVLYTDGSAISAKAGAALKRFVENGGGLVGLHGAAMAEANRDCLELFGAQIAGNSPCMEFQVRPSDNAHPAVARTSPFHIQDELVFLKPLGEFKTFAVAHWQGKDQPVGIERQAGKGRALYISLGHGPEALGNRDFQRMLDRAVRVSTGETFSSNFRAGILGYGGAFNMGKAHAEALRQQHGMSITAVCDADLKRTEQAKTELGADIKTFNDMDRFFGEGQFDLAVVILPHNLHAKACIAAAKAGKHVVTEKPFCITLKEADDMIAAARQSGTMLSCFHNRRWDGDFYNILKLVRAGAIGEVFRIDGALGGFHEPGTWWRSSKEISGGMMYDWGAHYCDWILNLANKRVASVTGDFQKRRWHTSTNEDFTFALIRFEDDTTATLEQSGLSAVSRTGWRILGTHGAISNTGPHSESTLVRYEQGIRTEAKVPGGPGTAFTYYANVVNHLAMGERLVVTPEQARRTIGVISCAEQSAKKGGVPVKLPGEDAYTPDYMIPW